MNIEDMIHVNKLHHVMLEITTDCNLKCTYCCVSQPKWEIITLHKESIDEIINEIKTLSPEIVHIHGHGETTIINGWESYVNKLIDNGIKVSICTNLSKNYTDLEIDTFTKMSNISISIDTVDENLFRKLRRGGNIKNIFYNQIKILTKSLMTNNHPNISWSVVVSNQNAMFLQELVNCGIILKVSGITFCNLEVNDKLRNTIEISHVSEMSIEDCKTVLNIFNTIEAYCLQHQIICDIKPGIIDSLNYKITNGHTQWTKPTRIV